MQTRADEQMQADELFGILDIPCVSWRIEDRIKLTNFSGNSDKYFLLSKICFAQPFVQTKKKPTWEQLISLGILFMNFYMQIRDMSDGRINKCTSFFLKTLREPCWNKKLVFCITNSTVIKNSLSMSRMNQSSPFLLLHFSQLKHIFAMAKQFNLLKQFLWKFLRRKSVLSALNMILSMIHKTSEVLT